MEELDIFFSIFALVDILPKTDLDVWRKFVMACRMLTTKCISIADVSQSSIFVKALRDYMVLQL